VTTREEDPRLAPAVNSFRREMAANGVLTSIEKVVWSMKTALAAADAHDAAHGVYRLVIDDATVERAARALFTHYWDPEWVADWESPEALEEAREEVKGHVRAVLAAAVQEGEG
jgi:hypothetical protein